MFVYLHGLATTVPPHALPQDEVAEKAHILLGPRFRGFDRLAPVFETSGVRMRYSVAPLEWFETAGGWTERNRLYMDGATQLYIDAAQQTLEKAGWTADEVDILVTVTSTGIATPTLEAQAKSQMGFRDDCLRVPLFGLGCAGGISGLNVATELARANRDAKVLLVIVETCTLSFRHEKPSKADIIATILFGDGAAAVALNGAETSVRIGRGATKTWPDTLPIMGWDVEREGLGVVFDRSIPDFTRAEFRAATETALSNCDLSLNQIDRLIAHPGGAKVVEAIEVCLELPSGTLDHEREVLRQYGNMSAPTVLFVLKSVLDSGATGQFFSCALGPGFSAAYLPIEVT